MTDRVVISEVEALDRMRRALDRYRDHATDAVNRVRSAIDHTLGDLGDAILSLRRKVEVLEQEKQSCESALRNCHDAQHNSRTANDAPNCLYVEKAYYQALQAHAQAAAHLSAAESMYDVVERGRDDFGRAAHHFAAAAADAASGGGSTLSGTAARARAVHAHRNGLSGWIDLAGRILGPRAPSPRDGLTREGSPATEPVEGRWRWSP